MLRHCLTGPSTSTGQKPDHPYTTNNTTHTDLHTWFQGMRHGINKRAFSAVLPEYTAQYGINLGIYRM